MASKIISEEMVQIAAEIEAKHNFLLSGGAGSGKTYSLVETIRWIIEHFPHMKIGCITYTNSAANEIKDRVNHENLVVSTIHDFLWDFIKPFKRELVNCLVQIINNNDFKSYKIKGVEKIDETFYWGQKDFKGISYEPSLNLAKGLISHDEVLLLANHMFQKHKKLCDIFKSRFPILLVDEYQDTHDYVIQILLNHLKLTPRQIIIGFYGDSMQAIYENGIGDLNAYIGDEDKVHEIKKAQNRRNPQTVITLANKLRKGIDNIVQEPSSDLNAPNMDKETSLVKQGRITFLYSKESDGLKKAKAYLIINFGWDFEDYNTTKELNLTHRLIAEKAGFKRLLELHDKDRILEFGKSIKNFVIENNLEDLIPRMTFGEVLLYLKDKYPHEKKLDPLPLQMRYIDQYQGWYEYALNLDFNTFVKIHISKDDIMDDNGLNEAKDPSFSTSSDLRKHLDKIETVIRLYKANRISEFIKATGFKSLRTIKTKKELKEAISQLAIDDNSTIGEVIQRMDELMLVKIDDHLKNYKERYPYVYERIAELPYQEFRNLYNFLAQNTPYSTQHKTKGKEFDNVFVNLDNGKWNNYDFSRVFETNPKKDSKYFRSLKLFYVCCTRTKNQLGVFMQNPSPENILNAKWLFGELNVINVD